MKLIAGDLNMQALIKSISQLEGQKMRMYLDSSDKFEPKCDCGLSRMRLKFIKVGMSDDRIQSNQIWAFGSVE